MAWTPGINTVDESVLAPNLLAYITANQTEALAWASGGSALADFAAIYNSASGRLGSLYPNLSVVDADGIEQIVDASETEFAIRFEGALTGPDPDALTTDCADYVKALKSMLANIPLATLTAGADDVTGGWVVGIETSYDAIGTKAGSTSFLQIFQIRVTYKLIISSR